jgi:hypothetical protein
MNELQAYRSFWKRSDIIAHIGGIVLPSAKRN